MHLFEKQMFICDEHRVPLYGLALGTGANAALPDLSWVGKEWSLVRECSSFHFGRRHFGLVIGPSLGLDLDEIHCLLDAIPTLEYSGRLHEHGDIKRISLRPLDKACGQQWFSGRIFGLVRRMDADCNVETLRPCAVVRDPHGTNTANRPAQTDRPLRRAEKSVHMGTRSHLSRRHAGVRGVRL